MDRRVDLPSGGYAVLRDPLTVTNKERKPIVAQMDAAQRNPDQIVTNFDLTEQLVVLMVKEWTHPFPLPSQSRDSLDEIPTLDYDRLCISVQDKESRIFLDVTEKPDPKDQNGSRPNSGNSGMDSSTTTSAHASISLPRSVSTA